jgi:hypothetical protein
MGRKSRDLAQLLKATNRLSEAEPLMRRCVASHLKFGRLTGYFHPNLQTVFGNYFALLAKMALSQDDIQQRVLAQRLALIRGVIKEYWSESYNLRRSIFWKEPAHGISVGDGI